MGLTAWKLWGQCSNLWLHFAPLAHIASPPGARCRWLHEKAFIAKPRPPCRKGTVSSVLKFATHAANLENVTRIAKAGSATMAKQKHRSQMQNAHTYKLACIAAEHSYTLIKHLGCMHCCCCAMLFFFSCALSANGSSPKA